MASAQPIHTNEEAKEQTPLQTPLQGNLISLCNIIGDISQKLNHQVLGNCDILANSQKVDKETIDNLIRQPVKLILGRLGGVQRTIKNQLAQLNFPVEINQTERPVLMESEIQERIKNAT